MKICTKCHVSQPLEQFPLKKDLCSSCRWPEEYPTSPEQDRFWSLVDTRSNNCWKWTGSRTPGGYGQFRGYRAHRYSYQLVNGPIPPGMVVCHACDNPSCVRPDHLFLGTHLDNMDDAHRKGRFAGNPGRPHALTASQIDQCRQMRAEGLSYRQIERLTGWSRSSIQRVIVGTKYQPKPSLPPSNPLKRLAREIKKAGPETIQLAIDMLRKAVNTP